MQETQHAELVRLAERNEEEAAERDLWSDYRRDNPGDYECPHCKYKTLKFGATRCPKCQGILNQEQQKHIARLAAREAENLAKQHARFQREQQERERILAEQESARRERAKAENIAAGKRRLRTLVFFVFCTFSSLLLYFSAESDFLSGLTYLFVPFVAWLSYWVSDPPYRKNLNRALVAGALVALAIPLWLHARIFSEAIEPLKSGINMPSVYGFGILGSPVLEVVAVGVVLYGFWVGRYIPPLLFLFCALTSRIVIGFA
ncbi:hypothetical protein CKO25_20415 [Thiocapsa imhoffii]|uniref:Uncharacterized protein n=1 Tax=Thiocapsa imhoffii TaxID=382777 RepID=A0A9X1BBL7_9GAMM|nr:hypothetical protein [Thiocapsa imhoffii]MBK1646938.1 hypothetical protein [Thiocapsa imhoffii]